MNTDSDSAVSLKLVDNPSASRFELWDDHTLLGLVGYEVIPASMSQPQVYRLMHTVVEEEYGRQGVARLLVTMVMTRLRLDGHLFEPICTYVQRYLHRFPEYRSMSVRRA